jgi:signal transduction histidine kinase/ligand-binding sensor domain-containing protein
VLGPVLACILLACCPAAFALNPSLDVSQYAHTSWKIRDGFTKGTINSIAQTPDGFLWLGTEFGLFRFDGLKNVQWQPPTDQQLPDSHIYSLLAARDGTLWIGTAKGLASWKDGKLTQYAELTGQYIFKLLEDREGTVWASGANVPIGKLCSIQNSHVKCYGEDGSLGIGVVGLFEDSQGSLWVGVPNGLWRWKPGQPKFYPLPEPNGIRGLGEDEGGALLVGYKGGIQRFSDGKTEAYPLPAIQGNFTVKRLLHDRDGGAWIGTQDRGIVHVHQGRTDVFALSEGLSGENVFALFEDREGNIWVATSNGLDRFRDFAVANFGVNQGLSNAVIETVLATRDGSVWIVTNSGLSRWKSGQLTTYRERHELTTTGVHEIVGRGIPDRGLRSLFEDDRGRVWISTDRSVGYLENDRLFSIKGLPGGAILAINEDKAGSFWIVNETAGLFHLVPGGEIEQIPWAALGHRDHVTTLAPDPFQTGLWLGFHLGGIAYFADGQIRTSYTTADGLAPGRVNDLRLDQSGVLWAATDGGLSRLKNSKVTTLSSKNGLPCDAVHWVMEDDTRAVWLHTECGLVRIERSGIDAWAAAIDNNKDAKPIIQTAVFDNSDGVRITSDSFHLSPQVAKSTDGRLWFCGPDGVSVIDPGHLPFNRLPPPVHVNQITADRQTYDVSSDSTQRLHLPPLIRDLQIDYTALSLVAPEKVRFRYKLEGYDRDWHEADIRRQAFYTNLPPRNYRFRVTACNNNGVWNETGTYFDFTIDPAYYQTTWFRVAGLIAFLLMIGVIYQLRLQQVAKQVRGRMEERLEERERIARDLHDTLLQSVQGLILKFHAVLKQIPDEMPAHNALEKTLDHADEVLAEGRARIQNLRVNPVSLSDLPAAFRSIAEETSQGRETMFKTVVEGHVRDLHPLVLEECYCIGREAIINALTHSEGQQVELEITYDSRQFRLRVRDNGRGIDPKILEEGGRPGHWGLQGMHERAHKVGGQLKFWSRPETGTEVELSVPGATAYQGLSDKSNKKFWLNRFQKLGVGVEKTDD